MPPALEAPDVSDDRHHGGWATLCRTAIHGLRDASLEAQWAGFWCDVRDACFETSTCKITCRDSRHARRSGTVRRASLVIRLGSMPSPARLRLKCANLCAGRTGCQRFRFWIAVKSVRSLGVPRRLAQGDPDAQAAAREPSARSSSRAADTGSACSSPTESRRRSPVRAGRRQVNRVLCRR